MSETLSRADKTQTEITYEVELDEKSEQIVGLQVTVLCAMRTPGAGTGPQREAGALSELEHVAFKMVYRFSGQGEVEPFEVPRAAGRLLR